MSTPVGARGEEAATQRFLPLPVAPAVPLEDVLRDIIAQAMALTGAARGALWIRRNEPQEERENVAARGVRQSKPQPGRNTANASNANASNANASNANASNANANPADANNAHVRNAATPVESVEADDWLCLRLPRFNTEEPDETETADNSAVELAPAALEELPAAVLQTGRAQSASPGESAVSAQGSAASAQQSAASAQQSAASAQIALPLQLGAHIVGVLQLGDVSAPDAHVGARTDGPEEFQGAARDARVALFCEQAAVTIANARLFQQLQNAKREWEVTFDGMLDGVCIERADGSILRANRAIAASLGLRMSEILGSRRQDLYARLPGYQLLRPLQRAASGAAHEDAGLNVRNGEFRFGEPERIIAETVFALRLVERRRRARRAESDEQAIDDSSRGHTVCVLRDVTEQRRLQDQLLQSEKLAALGELVSGVAHELNNPLTTVVGYAQLLQDDSALSDTVRRQMNVIHTEAARASRIVGNLLAFARREEPHKTRLSLDETLRPVVQMRAYQLQAHNTRITTDFEAELPPVWGDAHQLQQVFLNIINNAHQAMEEWRGGGEIEITAQAVALSGAPGVRVTIADNGPGIAPEHLRRVFDPFFTTKPSGEGTGLGMSLSLGIISNHEGRIWAESRLGHGARFIVELPGVGAGEENGEPEERNSTNAISPLSGLSGGLMSLDEAASDTAAASEVSEAESSSVLARASIVPAEPAKKPREILVVDDEEPVVMLMTEVLGLDGHRVTPAFNGAEALALLQEQDYDLIISDVRMPAVGGPTFFEILQTTRPDLLPRVVFVTGDTVSPSTRDFLRKAGRPMLAKPFDPERLRALVASNLGGVATS